MRKGKIVREIVGILLTIVVIFTIVFGLNLTVFTTATVNQISMRNTLIEGDIVYYNRFANKPHEFARGDIVLFLAGGKEYHGIWDAIGVKLTDLRDSLTGRDKFTNERYVKRIIGLPGDIIEIDDDGKVYVNGEIENKAYVLGKTSKGNMEYPLTVPDNHFFVMGDNREMSKDSRHFGCVSIHSFEGKASFIIWPPSKVKKIK
ncbi:MAG: signal peptidase I [Acetivibrionales bacterium]|jgi:signal peptidase I